MSSSLEISTADESFPKVVLHERNKPEMGTNFVGTKTRITAKRNIVLKEKSKETETTVLENKISKCGKSPIRSKKQHTSSENNSRRKILPERKNITKSMKSDKDSVKKTDLSKNTDVNNRNLAHLNDTNDSLSKKKSGYSDVKTVGNMSSSYHSGFKNISTDGNSIPQMHGNDCHNDIPSADETCGNMVLLKYSDKDKCLPETDIQLSQTSEVSTQKDVCTAIQNISSSTSSHALSSIVKSSELDDDVKVKEKPTCSDTQKQISHKKSIPKPQSVILNSCDSQQKNFKLSDVNKDTFCNSNTSDLQHLDCNEESDQIKNVVTSNCKQPQNITSLSKESAEQTAELSQNTKLSAQNIKLEKKSLQSTSQGKVPSYLRMTSSAANKEIKKKSENTQRSVTQDNNIQSSLKQKCKSLNMNELKCSVTKRNLKPSLKSNIKSQIKINQGYHVEDRKRSSSSPEEDLNIISRDDKSLMSSSTSSETETTAKSLNKISNISSPTEKVQNAKQEKAHKDVSRSSSSQKLKSSCKSTAIPKIFKESVAKKHIKNPMDLNARPRSVTPTDSKPIPNTVKRQSSHDTSLSLRSRSTTPGDSSVSSDSSCSNKTNISNKNLKHENTKNVCMKGDETQKHKIGVNGLIMRPPSLTRTDTKSKSLNIKRHNSENSESARSRSATPDASSIPSDGIISNETKLSTKTLDLHPQSVHKSQQLKVYKPKQDSKLTNILNKESRTSKPVKATNMDLNSRQRLDTKLSSPALSKKSNISINNKSRTDDQMISNIDRKGPSSKRDYLKSRSRSKSPDVSPTWSGTSTASCPSKTPHSRKETSFIGRKVKTNTSSVQLQSARILVPSVSKSSDHDTSSSKKTLTDKAFKDRESKARSKSNTSGAASTGSCAKSNIKEFKNTNQGASLKCPSSNVQERKDTQERSIALKTSSTTSSKTAMIRNQSTKDSLELDRKSRSRSSTPGVSSLNKCSKTCKGSISDHKTEQEKKKKPSSDQTKGDAKIGHISKIPREISGNSRKNEDKKVRKQKEKTPISDIPKVDNEHCNILTNEKNCKQIQCKVITNVQTTNLRHVPPAVDNNNCDMDDKQFDIFISNSTQNHKTEQDSVVDSKSDKNFSVLGSNNISEQRTITVLDFKHKDSESCNSFSTISGNSSESKAASGMLYRKGKNGSQTKNAYTREEGKMITELTDLSVKPVSMIKPGKIQNSVKYKNSQLQASLDNKSQKESERTNTENKAIKALTSDNKSRQAQQKSAIKIDDISTRSRSKSKERETRKQNSQLSGKLTLSKINSKSKSEGVYVSDELIGEASCQTSTENEASRVSKSDYQNSGIKEITQSDFNGNIEAVIGQKKSDNSKDLNFNKNENHENSNILLKQSSITCEIDNRTINAKYSDNSVNIKYTDLTSNELHFDTCVRCRDNYPSDRIANAPRDPRVKVINNCLSDVRENEIQPVLCELYTGINAERDESANCRCDFFPSEERKRLKTGQNETDLGTGEPVNTTVLQNLKLCSICSMEKDSSIACTFQENDVLLCDSCKYATEKNSKNKYVEDYLNNAASSVSSYKKDLKVELSKCKCGGNCETLECYSSAKQGIDHIKLKQQSTFKSIHQYDKKSKTSTFKIDTYDVNSSNEMPITKGCAFKHTDLSDLGEDKVKCTHAVPVTGAVSFQSTNKRQDKTIASLSNSGESNPTLCSNKNCLLLDAYTFIVPNFDICEYASVEPDIKRMEKETDTNVVMSEINASVNSNISEISDVSQNYIDSVRARQNSQECNYAEKFEILRHENEANLQVINNCEINKETSEPTDLCGNLEIRDNMTFDNNNIAQKSHNTTSTEGQNICSSKYGMTGDFNLQNMERIVGNDEINIHCDNLKLSSSNASFHEVDELKSLDCNEYVITESDKIVNKNEEEKSSIQYKNIPNSEIILVEGSRPEKTITCSSDSDEGIVFPDRENDLPERNSRTMDVKLIYTDHDLSLDAQSTSTNVSKITNDFCPTGLLLDKNCTACDDKQIYSKSDENSEKSSNDEEIAINGILPITNFLQNQLQRLKPGGYLSEEEMRTDITCKPCVLDSQAQEKETNCLCNENDAQCLFVKESNIEDGLIVNDNFFHQNENDTPVGNEKTFLQDKEYLINEAEKNEENESMQKSNEKEFKSVPNSNNSSFCNIPLLSELICAEYPKLKGKTKLCSESSNKKEINREDRRCSNMTQNANLNTCFSNMKLNDSACLLQSYTQLDSDDIKVSSECLHCANLSQTSENISNSYSKKLHLLDDLTEANSTDHGSLKITGNKLCTGSIPCDGNKEEISTHIILSKSTENTDLNDLSLPFDVFEDNNSRWTMSRDFMRVAAEDTELSSELSANWTDSETLKTHNHGSNQDCYEDKQCGELSAVKITTQQSSCNLKFSEKSNEPKDLLLRYEHHKNSAGHKKIYSCKDELDIGIASTQEEYNFRNLAAIRDEDINCEIKLNNINLESPKHCVPSSLESERSGRKVISSVNEEQYNEIENNSCSVDNEKYFATSNEICNGQLNSDKESNFVFTGKRDIINKETVLSFENNVTSDNQEHRSDKNNPQIQSEDNGLLQEHSIKTDICQTEGNLNALLTPHKNESIPKLNLPGKLINSDSGVECAKNKYINQTIEHCHEEISQESCCALDIKTNLDSECMSHTENKSQNKNRNNFIDIQVLNIITKENGVNERSSSLQESEQVFTHDSIKSSDTTTNAAVLCTQENVSPSEETLSDASESFTDAEDRLSSPNTENIRTFDSKHCATGSIELNISCGASTSTESFVDAVESLDDDYLTTTNFRNSREFQNEETVSQNSSSTNDSSTGIAGSMDDLSGWEEFSENIEDINDYNGDMEAKSCVVTNTEGKNSRFRLTDGQTHAPVCIAKHVFHDKNNQSPSPPLEPSEIYLSKIKTSTLRYKDMRNGAEQKIIGNSIFETGNGGTINDIDVTGVRNEANDVRNVTYKSVSHIGDGQDNTTIFPPENEIQYNITDLSKMPSKIAKIGNDAHSQENNVSQIESNVGSKIETAVIKRTERRRRRQIEQQKCTACDSKSEDMRETNSPNIIQREQARDNESIEKSSCSHSKHSKYSCTVSDNMTFNNEQASGTGELSQQVNISLNLNESNLDHGLNSGTPLNYDCGDYITNDLSIQMDKTDKINTNEITNHTLTDKKNEIKTQLAETFISETQCERKSHIDNTVTEIGINHNAINEVVSNNEVELTIEFKEQDQRNEIDFDDIEFIDADESNQEDHISPNVSFTFSIDENCKVISNEKCDCTNDAVRIYSEEDSCDDNVNSTKSKLDTKCDNEACSNDSLKENITVLEELEVTYEKNTLKTSEDIRDSKTNMKGVNTEEICTSTKEKGSTADEIILDSQQNSANIDIKADVCEESNISVKLALELEKQKLADDDENRSRKGLFMSKRAGRRATIETCSFESTEDAERVLELRNDKDAKDKKEIKKSKSFRIDRKQISPMASFMNPPEISESSESKDSNDNVEHINKKVSDICKTFMTKTRSSVQKSRAKTLSKSPAPHRKLMKWVNNNGKWMRMPVDDTAHNRDETTATSSPSDLSLSSDSTETCSPITPDITISIECTQSEVINEKESEKHSHSENIQAGSATQETLDEYKTGIQSNKDDLIETSTGNTTSDMQKRECTQTASFVEETKLQTREIYEQDTKKSPIDKDQTEKSDKEAGIDKRSNDLCTVNGQHSNQSESLAHISNTDETSKATGQIDSDQTSFRAETCLPDQDDELEMKVIGTTFDDAQSDQEKHRQRQELLFGLLDSFNRRKPRRLTPHESKRDNQNTKKFSNSSNNANNIEIQCSDNNNVQKHETKADGNFTSIPKIKAIKIQEEVFECKSEYLKDTNISESSQSDIKVDEKAHIEKSMPKVDSSEKSDHFKPMKLPIRKSKTFAGLGDIERQGHMSRRFICKEKVQSDAKDSLATDEENANSVNIDKNEKELPTIKSTNAMADKRIKAGLKLNLERTKARIKNDFESDRSPSRLGPEQPRGRTSGDRSPNRLCVDQSKVRLRSPDKGPRQLQRHKLLSEIVEVEENKDDVTVTCERRQQQQQHFNDRHRPEGPKSVKRSNKRRSLSLPTGTLAFGDARIVYKNGHFTIETMDNSEYDSNEPSDYHSGSQQLDGNVDDMWEMPDTGGDFSRVKSDSRETSDIHSKPHMRRQNAKTVLQSSDSTEDVFYNENEYVENVSPYRININGDAKVLNMGRTSEEVFNESCSSRTSDMSVDSYYSEGMDLSTDDSVTDSQKLSSSSLPDTKDVEIKRVMQRAKRTSSFRAAQEGGALRLSGIDEDKVHNSTRARSVSLDESQKSDLNKSPKIQSAQNQNPTFLKKVMAKRKTLNENLNMSGFTKQSESAKEFFTKKMTLKGLFRKNKSDSSVNSPIKTEHPVSPPIATFQDDDIGSVDTPPGSPYRSRNLRRRHTSADILKTYPDSSETDSNCPTPTQERSNKSRHSISSPSTPSHEANSFLNLSSHSSAPQFRDDDEMSITSASSFASSIHSPPLEQPHKPKTPKPVGASPRRNQSFSSHLSRSSSQSSQRNVMNSVTSLESDHYEPLQDDVIRDPRCECVYRSEERKRKMSNRNVRGSTDSITMCQFCKQMEFYKSDSVFYKQQLTSKEKQSDDGARVRKDSSGRNNYDRLGIISQADVASSNSNDSGIQRDASLHSSNESIKGTTDTRLRLRRNKSLSPHPDRPKSEISVRWADGDSGDYDITETTVKLRNKSARDKPRPKSDLDGSSFLSDRMKAFGSEINLQPYCSLRSLYEMKRNDLDRQKNRRMSTPHPIKSRLQRVPQKLHKQPALVRSSSMPESLEKIHKRRKMHHLLDYHLDSLSRHVDIDTLSDESDLSFDQASLQERSVSVQSSSSQLTAMDEDEDNLTYAEALWDHITMDPEELGFRAQDVIEVLDMADKDWWFGVIDDREGWFPATFVRIRVNQDELDDDLDLDTTIQDNLTTSPKLRRTSMFNKNQARSNVVNEIINAEREYVKHLKDVVEGYIQHARKRTEMFPEERIALIFGNLEKIYSFAQKFVSQLEMCIDVCPHLSEIGQCFLDNERGFEIYSDYCNNHPSACEELDELCKDSKYKHFFEACRLLQELVEIPLEGFLLTPVQKICKYPLQLAELLKYTPPDHADYMKVKDALAAMRKIATLINERKRKMESIEKIAVWQHSVVDWEGPDLLEGSSELIFSGELNKINTAGWSQERFFFLFDHQIVYCKKELLKRHVFSYKGRIDLDHCKIIDVPDGKDSQYNVTVKHAWKFHETVKDKWYLIYAKSEAVKQSWLKAIRDERQRVMEDQENDFCVPDHWKQTVLNKVRSQSNIKDKQSGGRMSHGQLLIQKDLKDFTYSTIPRHRISQKHAKKKGWFSFGGGKKSKR